MYIHVDKLNFIDDIYKMSRQRVKKREKKRFKKLFT